MARWRPALAPSLVVPTALVLAACSGTSMLAQAPPPSPMAQQPSYALSYPAPCAPPAAAPKPCDPCAAPVVAMNAASLPPDAAPGEVWCYIRVPAVTQTVSEQVLVTPGGCREEWVPPVTQEVTEQVCLKPEQRVRVPIPPEFEERVEQVLVCDTKTEWRKVDCTPKSMGQGEQVGECWTLVQVPPQYTTRSTRVCVRPESCREEVLAAEYAPQTRVVTVSEGYMRKVEVPPVYDVRMRDVDVSPARWEWRRTSECEVPEAAGQPYVAVPPEALPPAAPAEPLPALEPAPVPAPAPAPIPAEPAPGVPSPAIPDAPAFDAPPAGALPPVPSEIPASK